METSFFILLLLSWFESSLVPVAWTGHNAPTTDWMTRGGRVRNPYKWLQIACVSVLFGRPSSPSNQRGRVHSDLYILIWKNWISIKIRPRNKLCCKEAAERLFVYQGQFQRLRRRPEKRPRDWLWVFVWKAEIDDEPIHHHGDECQAHTRIRIKGKLDGSW